jgi:L-iditol 2-dehydrogenase
MKAAILSSPGQLVVADMDPPPCPETGVVVAVDTCGICSADVKMVSQGHRALEYPRILGHEIAGRVMARRNCDIPVGARVQVAPGLGCGHCRYCRLGMEHRCPAVEILGFSRDGGFAQYIAVPLGGPVTGALVPLPDDLSFAAASLAEPVACAINAQQRLDIGPGDTVWIVGAGPLGLIHTLLARHRGASRIIVTEPSAHRRNKAASLGADRIFDSRDPGVTRAVRQATGGNGVDALIFACSGVTIDERFIGVMARGGRIAIFSGVAPSCRNVPWDLNAVHYLELTVSGAYGCSARHCRQAVDLLARNVFPVDALVTHRTGIDGIQTALTHSNAPDALKTLVEVTH